MVHSLNADLSPAVNLNVVPPVILTKGSVLHSTRALFSATSEPGTLRGSVRGRVAARHRPPRGALNLPSSRSPVRG